METNPREEKGRQIARSTKLKPLTATRWSVPSQSGTSDVGGYLVDVAATSCTCPDHDTRKVFCKHLWAVTFYVARELGRDGTVVETTVTVEHRKTYPQAWPAYNAAQVNEQRYFEALLADLCSGIAQPPRKPGPGNNPMVLRDAVYACVHKVFTTMSGRRAQSALQGCADKGYISTVPSYNTMFRCMENPAVTPILVRLVEDAASPLAVVERGQFAQDSTGFSTVTYERWFDEKHGKLRSEHLWVKLHAFIGTLTNVVAAVEVSGTADCPVLEPLLAKAAKRFKIAEVSGDKAYLSVDNCEAVEKIGAVPFFPFKENSTGAAKSEAFKRMWCQFTLHLDEWLPHYHRRSNAESTFAMVKAKFGGGVRSKLRAAQVNECLAKIVCHNLACVIQSMFEFGIKPDFSGSVATGQSMLAAVQP